MVVVVVSKNKSILGYQICPYFIIMINKYLCHFIGVFIFGVEKLPAFKAEFRIACFNLVDHNNFSISPLNTDL